MLGRRHGAPYPVPRLWISSAEVRGGTSLGEWEHNNNNNNRTMLYNTEQGILEGDVSDIIALDQLTLPFSPRKATRMSP